MKLVCGVGINDADYVTQKWEHHGYDANGKQIQTLVWKCPFYNAWVNMLSRAYSVKTLKRQPTYEGTTVCKEWHTFSVFRTWMEKQEWEGNQLDKDLLVQGNKEYNPETCCFLPQTINNFIARPVYDGKTGVVVEG